MTAAIQTEIRKVGGTVRAANYLEAENVRIEYIRRDTDGALRWHFRNPQATLFWYRRGARTLRAKIAGKQMEKEFHGQDTFALYPPGVEIDGEWSTAQSVEYAVVFLPSSLIDRHLAHVCDAPLLAFRDEWLTRSLAELRNELSHDDEVSRLSAAGWVLQAVARLRRHFDSLVTRARADGEHAMTTWQSRKLLAYLEENIAETLSNTDIANVLGVSPRHCNRMVQKTFGTSLHRYLKNLRITHAERLLTQTDLPITEIALATGFGNSQHFATMFKTATGSTASQVRSRSKSLQASETS